MYMLNMKMNEKNNHMNTSQSHSGKTSMANFNQFSQ